MACTLVPGLMYGTILSFPSVIIADVDENNSTIYGTNISFTESQKDLLGKKTINGVKLSFHPAGHIIGSAQIRLEYKGKVVVFTGDYKVKHDHITIPFESNE